MRPFHQRLFRGRIRNEEHHNASVSPDYLGEEYVMRNIIMRPFHQRLFRGRIRNEEHHNAPVSPEII